MEDLRKYFSEEKHFGIDEIISYLTELERIVKLGKSSLRERLTKLAGIVDQKIPYRDGHSIRVSQLSKEVSRKLKLSKQEIFNIEISALLHDFGKIAIEEKVLQKKKKLTERDWIEIKMHPVRGYLIVQGFTFLKSTLPGIRWHHERMNGSGYPDGLRGTSIPLMSRIIAVSDTFDAMIQSRPYKKKISILKAKNIIEDMKQKLLDEVIVDTFLSIPDELLLSIF